MWATWGIFITVGLGGLLLVVALIVGASPLLAVAIFVVLAGVLFVARRLFRNAQGAAGGPEANRRPAAPRTGGAPVSGEGGVPPR